MTPEPDRRSFLAWVIFGLGAIFATILGFPIVCYIIDPRHRKGPKSSFKLVDGVKLDELATDQPRQGVIRDTRTDGWTLYPNDVIGRVWVTPQEGPKPDLSSEAKINEFNAKPMSQKEKYLLVFTTICPHLGCSVNFDSTAKDFACPCHNAVIKLDGAKVSGPQQRGMDTLEWEIDPANRLDRIRVKFQTFKASKAEKELA